MISNEEMEEIMKTVKSFEELGLLIKGISETIKNESKERNGEFLPMLLRTLAASNFSNSKSKVEKLDIRKLETTPADLSKLSNVVKKNVVKKTEYNEFVWKS